MSDEPYDIQNDIDICLNLIENPLEAKDALDRIIAYQRKLRTRREEGVKTKKPVERARGGLDVSALLSKPVVGITRRH